MHEHDSRFPSFAFWAGVLLVLSASVFRGGNRYVALIGLEWLALVVVFGAVWQAQRGRRGIWGERWERWALMVLMTSPAWIAALHLVPMNVQWWVNLPNRTLYVEAMNTLGIALGDARPLSLTPDATWVSALASLPLLACMALGAATSDKQVQLLCRLWVGVAMAQALLGVVQVGPFPGLLFGSLFGGSIGTFANTNHMASFLVMAMPLAAWEFHRCLLQRARQERAMPQAGWLWMFVVLVLLVGALVTSSRAGIATALLALGVSSVLLWTRGDPDRGRRWSGLVAGALVFALGLASVGLEWSRDFERHILASDTSFRTEVALSTWHAAMAFWPTGSGLGSFAAVYPTYQPGSVVGFIEHAHSDYVQLLMELGIVFPFLTLLLLVVLWSRLRGVVPSWFKGFRMRSHVSLKLAAFVGLLCLSLHAWVDFNLRIPALAMFGCFLLGVLLRRQNSLEMPQSPKI